MTPAVQVAVLLTAFSATHLGLASIRVEPRLRERFGDSGFVGLYSVVALVLFVPLLRIYFGHLHEGPWLWVVPATGALRVFLYGAMILAMVLVVSSLLKPSPASLVPGSETIPSGAFRITRHPLVLGLGLLMALHLIPNASTTDLAFFGGLSVFTVLGAWHQDRRKLHSVSADSSNEQAVYRTFVEATPFLPFTGRDTLRGLREIPLLVWALGIAASLGARWLHGSIL